MKTNHGVSGLSAVLRDASRRRAYRWLVAVALVAVSQPAAQAQTVLPANVKPTCTVLAAEFKNWFTTGSVAVNGGVDPADSVTFVPSSNCSFYKWSEQMFLWLTSPVPTKYGTGTHVFDSPVFYDVSPPVGGQRTLTANGSGRIRNLDVKISQLGSLNQRVVFDNTGKMFTVVHPEVGPTGKPAVRNRVGQPVEIERTEVAPDGKPIFRDKAGRTIDAQVTPGGTPRLVDRAGQPIDVTVNKAVINGQSFFLNTAGSVIDTESGQADANVLMAQPGGKLAFYALQVNDVFAYFLTGAKNGGITPAPTHFPTTPADLNQIVVFALSHSKTLPDANALAIEVKSSWIEAAGLNTSLYVTMTAIVPTYNTSNPAQWVPSGSKQVQLAMTGMHVVGSTAGHTEMVWATFEHVNNTRNAQYTYTTTANVTATVPSEPAGTWVFSRTPATVPSNQNRMSLVGANIVPNSPLTIGPSDGLRVNPWGTSSSTPQVTSNNTDLIAINNSVIGQLAAGDVRKNYIMTGTTWTTGGAPTGGNQVGTNQMANTTMETTSQPSNCFACHAGNMLGTPGGGGLSHIWGPLKPLFP